MQNIKSFEALAVYNDPLYGNDVFTVNYLPLDDLSGNEDPRHNAKPINDLLDGFQEGDIVTGLGMDGETEYTGSVVNIKKDSEGENAKIFIQSGGNVVELKATSVRMKDDRGAQGLPSFAPPMKPMRDPENYYPPSMMGETAPVTTTFKNIKSFSEFNG